MRDPRPGPHSSRKERLDEAKRFGGYLFLAMMCSGVAITTAGILIFRRSINFDTYIMIGGSISAGVAASLASIGVFKKQMIVVAIVRLWTIMFLFLQIIVFVGASAAWMHYGVHNPQIKAVDSALAAGLSFIGLFFGILGLIRGVRHRWFAHVLQPGYTK